MQTDCRILEIEYDTEDFAYRTPIKFGGSVVDRATILNVRCRVTSRSWASAIGRASMPLGNVWSFPSRTLQYDQTLAAMTALAARIADSYDRCVDWGHPIAITHALEPKWPVLAENVRQELKLPEPIPILCVLVAASALDAALHDAYGKLHGRSCYLTYGSDFLSQDLAAFLGRGYEGLRLGHFLRREPVESLPLYHLVGALDALTTADVTQPVGDGLPETLQEWIVRDGLTHLKIKLNGDDLAWDLNRVRNVEAAAVEVQQQRNVIEWHYSLDFNERCPNVEYLLDFLHHLRTTSPAAFERIQYIEQPTHRDLKAHPDQRVHEAAKIKPVVIDESLVDLESLLLAREMGYNGVALKACKGQTQSLLMAAAAKTMGMFLCVQDLTCPGAAFVHSAGLAAHVPGVAAIEGNARQYMPQANRESQERLPGLFIVRNGRVQTGSLQGPGLFAYPSH